MSFSTSLQTVLSTLDDATDGDGRIALGPKASAALKAFMVHAIGTASALEETVGVDQINAASLIAFALQGEPRPSAEILDLSEILGREKVSRITSEAGPELAENAKNSSPAQFYVFPTVPRTPFNGGDAA